MRSHAANLRLVTLTELQNAINAVLPNVASNDGTRLFFTSPTIGNVSSIAIAPGETLRCRRYVTRATIINEASQAVLGFMNRQSQGTPATKAQVIGERDLSRGVNLQTQRFLRISIDGQLPQEIDFASNPRIARPRAATLKEIIAAINEQLGTEIASDNGKQLIFTSTNKIEFLPPQGVDARSPTINFPNSGRKKSVNFATSAIYNDSRFENARAVVLGGEELPVLTDEILQPSAIGILQAKAAGIEASVTRDRCGEQ